MRAIRFLVDFLADAAVRHAAAIRRASRSITPSARSAATSAKSTRRSQRRTGGDQQRDPDHIGDKAGQEQQQCRRARSGSPPGAGLQCRPGCVPAGSPSSARCKPPAKPCTKARFRPPNAASRRKKALNNPIFAATSKNAAISSSGSSEASDENPFYHSCIGFHTAGWRGPRDRLWSHLRGHRRSACGLTSGFGPEFGRKLWISPVACLH